VFWVYAPTVARFAQSYHEIARKLQLGRSNDPQVDVCELVCDWLEEEEHKQWLMILDNVDDVDALHGRAQNDGLAKAMIDYLPGTLSANRLLVVTTRDRDVAEELVDGGCSGPVIIGPFSQQQSQELLGAKIRCKQDLLSRELVDRLLKALAHVPLAITQAAAFMNRNGVSVSGYLAALERNENELMDHLSQDLQDPRRDRGFPHSIFRTWKMSFDQICAREPQTADLLSLMATLDGQQIPRMLLEDQTPSRAELSSQLGTLLGYSLIAQPAVDETYSMHPLVQTSVRYWLAQEKRKDHYVGQALRGVAERFPKDNYKNRREYEMLLPHAQVVLQHARDLEAHHKTCGELLHCMALCELSSGRYDLAYSQAELAHDIRRTLLGDKHKATLQSLGLLARVLGYQGKYEQAEEMHRRVLELCETVLGKKHPNTLTSMNDLATVLSDQGKYELAEEMHRRVLELRETVSGKEHPNTLTSMSNLATVLSDQGKYEQAEEMHRRVLKLRETVLGKEHPDTLISMGNLATVLSDQGKYEQAEEMHRRVLELMEKVLGKEHPDTLTSMNNLATVLSEQGKYEQAEEMHRRVLELRETVLGKEHPDTLASMNNLATVLSDQGKCEQAEEIHRRALGLRETVLGKEHPDTLTSMNNLATVLSYQGKCEQAEEIHRRALGLRQTVLGKEHPDTLASMNNLATVLSYQGKYKQAEEIYLRALGLMQTVLGKEHPHTLESMANLAHIWKLQGRDGSVAQGQGVCVHCDRLCNDASVMCRGLKLHIWNAVRLGATPEEVMEVFELASLMGVQSVMVSPKGKRGETQSLQGKRQREEAGTRIRGQRRWIRWGPAFIS
jgi:tetratricopeptide (TPR) repeat protein